MAAYQSDFGPQEASVPLDLHYSDIDYYSSPEWNERVIRDIRATGGTANGYLYAGNSHELEVVEGCSPVDAEAGRASAMARTIELFTSTP